MKALMNKAIDDELPSIRIEVNQEESLTPTLDAMKSSFSDSLKNKKSINGNLRRNLDELEYKRLSTKMKKELE